MRLTKAGSGVNPEPMAVTDVTAPSNPDGSITGGRYRNPLPLSTGALVATHTPTAAATRRASPWRSSTGT